MLRTAAGSALASALVAVALAAEQAKSVVPSGYQRITSVRGIYECVLPACWNNEGLNAYRGPDGRALEQLYPAAEVSADYCRSFRSLDAASYRSSVVDVDAFDNGHVRGCYSVRDVLNLEAKMEWRHISFRFPSRRGVEDVTIICEKAAYDEARTRTIRDSIRMAPAHDAP